LEKAMVFFKKTPFYRHFLVTVSERIPRPGAVKPTEFHLTGRRIRFEPGNFSREYSSEIMGGSTRDQNHISYSCW
jgi:hypothetical protein